MLTQENINEIKEILRKNKINKVKPKSMIELASELGISRQYIYLAINGKAKNLENKIKKWLFEQKYNGSHTVLKVKEEKVELLGKYGFVKQGENWHSKEEKEISSNLKTYLYVNEQLELSLVNCFDDFVGTFCKENNVNTKNEIIATLSKDLPISQLSLIYNLVKDNIVELVVKK